MSWSRSCSPSRPSSSGTEFAVSRSGSSADGAPGLDSDWGLAHSKGRLDAAGCTVLVNENADMEVAEAGEFVAERLGLLAAELEEERTAAPEEAGAVGEDASEDLGAVAAAVVGQRRQP